MRPAARASAALFALLVCPAAGVNAAAPASDATLAADARRQVPVGWSPNLGQVADASGRPMPDVSYSAEIPGARIIVTPQGLSHVFLARREGEPESAERRNRPGAEREPLLYDWARVDVNLLGARLLAGSARPEQPLVESGRTNYYLPQCPQGVRDVPSYARVTFPDVYPGIDWVVRTEADRSVHHDFVVSPGADPSQVRLQYEGSTSLTLSADGRELVVRTALGEVREGALRCWQGSPDQPVAARFRLDGDVVSVDLDAYDRSQPLVIDPPLSWYTLYGGNDFDGPDNVVTDPVTGDVYVVGYTESTNMPVLDPGGGAYYQGTVGGGVDGFVWKFDAAGVRLWATYFGGSGWDTFYDSAIDPAGNLFVCGVTPSNDLPLMVRPGAYNQGTFGGSQDGMLVEFGPSGALLWSTYYGGAGQDGLQAIAIDATGKVYVGGNSDSGDLTLMNPGGGAYFQGVPNANQPGYDALIARFGTNGALEWGTFYGGSPEWDLANGITVRGGNVILTGETSVANLPTLDPGGGAYFQGSNGGGQDGFIARFTTAGVLTWATYLGGNAYDSVDEPVVDANGNLFVDGSTYSTDLPTVNPGGTAWYQGALNGENDFLIARFDANAVMTWGSYLGGSGAEGMAGYGGKTLALDAQDRLYMTAMTNSTDFPLVNPGGGSFFLGTADTQSETVVLRFANDGTMQWSTYLGRPNYDFGRSITVATSGCVYVVGEITDNAGGLAVNPGGGAWFEANSNSFGQDEGFIARFCGAPSACCVDFTCVPVWSAAQCTALGGTEFHANTACTPTPCVTTCTVCGRKFSDLDGDGVQGQGEPGLAGWTIRLLDLNNVLVATATTDAQGDYCFTGLVCGSYFVAEVQQPGWVTTAPTGGNAFVGLGPGNTQGTVNFANRPCPGGPACVGVPPGVAARWTFDEVPGASEAMDVAHAGDASNRAQLVLGGATGEIGALCAASSTDLARVLASDQADLDFGTGSFAIAVRLRADASSAGPRVIVDKRALSADGTGVSGWVLYLMGQQAFLEIGTGATPQVVPGPILPAGTWTQLAVSANRAGGTGLWYVDGETQAGLGFVPIAGPVGNDADLLMGQAGDAFGPAPAFEGCLDEVVLFGTAVDEPTARKALGPPPVAWCPDYVLMPQVTTICRNRDSVQVCFQIGNNTAVAQTFQWSLAGLPAGAGCSVAGPVQFTPSAGTVTVPAGGTSGSLCVLVRRPAGLTAQNATACFQLSYINTATGVCRTRTATLRADTTCWCPLPSNSGFARVSARIANGGVIGFPYERPCDPTSAPWRVVAQWLDPVHADPLALSLNGLAPGAPVTGTLGATGAAEDLLEVRASYPHGFDAAARYELVLEVDTDGDGTLEPLASTIVTPGDDSTTTVSAPPRPAPVPSVRLVTQPNPFLGRTTVAFTLGAEGDVDLVLHDLGGRLVRRLAGGRLAAGMHRYEWDGRMTGGRRAPAGVYFVRLVAGGRTLEAKVVKVE